MLTSPSKICDVCKSVYYKNKYVCSKQWAKSRFCSKKCGWEDKRNNPVRPWLGKIRLDIRGENHYLWNGGINSSERSIAYGRVEYREWRRKVFERDNYTCQICNARGGVTLNADHIKPWSLYHELRYKTDNGRTLCLPCHKKTDTWGSKVRTYLVNTQEVTNILIQ